MADNNVNEKQVMEFYTLGRDIASLKRKARVERAFSKVAIDRVEPVGPLETINQSTKQPTQQSLVNENSFADELQKKYSVIGIVNGQDDLINAQITNNWDHIKGLVEKVAAIPNCEDVIITNMDNGKSISHKHITDYSIKVIGSLKTSANVTESQAMKVDDKTNAPDGIGPKVIIAEGSDSLDSKYVNYMASKVRGRREEDVAREVKRQKPVSIDMRAYYESKKKKEASLKEAEIKSKFWGFYLREEPMVFDVPNEMTSKEAEEWLQNNFKDDKDMSKMFNDMLMGNDLEPFTQDDFEEWNEVDYESKEAARK